MADSLRDLRNALVNKSPHSIICSLVSRLAERADALLGRIHPFGFIVVRLGSPAPDETLRLHMWPTGARTRQNPDWPIHSHPWHITSHILCGSQTAKLFSVREEPKGEFMLFTVNYEDDSSILAATGKRVSCSLTSTETYNRGVTYELEVDRYHDVDVGPSTFAATAVLTKQRGGASPLVVGEVERGSRFVFRREECSQELLIELIKRLQLELGHPSEIQRT